MTNHSAEKEIERLKKIIQAYEKLTALSESELRDADQTIRAQETVQELSGEEIRSLHQQIADLKTESQLRDRIKDILNEDQVNEAAILEALEEMRRDSGVSLLVDVFRVLTHYEFDAEEAERHWSSIIQHSTMLTRLLGRPVGLRVSMLDYFINQNKILKNPMMIEISIFDEMMKNTLLDELTQIYNRRYFDRSFVREINRARRHKHPVALAVFDIDHFKEYNDAFGHATGDKALQEVGRTLARVFRREDIPCRYGGEEFVAIMPETTSDKARIVCERFLAAVRELKTEGRPITISGGIAHFPEHGQEAGSVFLHADRALYMAKTEGKNRLCIAGA